MTQFLIANMAPLMFAALVVFLLFGYPVSFALAAIGLSFGFLGIELGLLTPALFGALPERIFGIMSNDTLLAVPFFTFMGLILERSGMAEDLLNTIGQLFGPIRGGLAYAVIFVGALLAATTGVVAASVISMGLISLPIMLRYGYDRRLASGVIAASGTLAQIIPPSLVLGVATPTEGGAMGATGALVLAMINRRLTWSLLRQAMNSTAKLTSFVVFILVGSTVFSLTFRGVNGDLWVEHLLTSLPGGQIGFLIVVNVLTFLLAFFLDFFELAFIIVPLLGPVADKLGIDLIWFGVLLGVNMQTSFMHPPFGFALFYLRSVAPGREYLDKLTGKPTPPVTTGQIYWGAVPFVVIQVIMVAIVIGFPGLVTGNLVKSSGDPSKVQSFVPSDSEDTRDQTPPDFGSPEGAKSDADRKSGESAREKREADDLENLFKK